MLIAGLWVILFSAYNVLHLKIPTKYVYIKKQKNVLIEIYVKNCK